MSVTFIMMKYFEYLLTFYANISQLTGGTLFDTGIKLYKYF